MIAIVCIDDGGGMMFNHRRQSQDRALRHRIAQLTKGANLWMNSYTARQFRQDLPENSVVETDFLDQAMPGDYVFVEDADLLSAAGRIERLIVFHWNRDYPRDALLPIDLDDWQLVSSAEFEGSSHELITQEEYIPA